MTATDESVMEAMDIDALTKAAVEFNECLLAVCSIGNFLQLGT